MKKMKKNIFYMIACGVMVLAAAACSKEQTNNEPQEEPAGLITESFSASKEDVTKVTMTSDGQFGWSTNDIVAFTINDGAGNYSFVSSDYYGETVANKFTVSYTGTREGYVVLPAAFKGSYNGTNLVVNYPTTYDISSFVDAGIYDNANGSAYIRFPMVATSTSGDNSLTFYSIGALVKVVVANVPKGTKKLYVTFNKKVTGNFTVTNPGTNTASVTAGSGSSTVTFTISSTGLASKQTITLYIPVPTTTGLSIAATSTTKTTVARNIGYQFNVEAISRVSTATDFSISGTKYVLSPGNLYAYNNSGEPEYHFWTAEEQVITTLGSKNEDPHAPLTVLEDFTNGKYKDSFTWNELYTIMNGSAPEGKTSDAITGYRTIDGANWYVPTQSMFETWLNSSRDNSGTIEVCGMSGALSASARIVLNDSIYDEYATYTDGLLKLVFGRFLFPDGYVDMTDLLSPQKTKTDTENRTVDFSAYSQMVDAGAVFMINPGALNTTGDFSSESMNGNWSYWTATADGTDATKAIRLRGGQGSGINIDGASRTIGRGVRLYKIVTP